MYKGKRILGLIPARGGSKGLPGKNILPLLGKPLIAWTIEEAKKSKYIDRLILSSEDKEIITIAMRSGCEAPFIRPESLALDDTPGMEPVLHALRALPDKYDYIVLLQPTSPMRKTEDIDSCIEQCIDKEMVSCVSVTEPDKSPFWMYSLDNNGKMQPIMSIDKNINKRQDLPIVYALNGAIYIAEVEWLLNNKTFITNETHAYIMPPERSVDIDTEIDLKLVEYLMQQASAEYLHNNYSE